MRVRRVVKNGIHLLEVIESDIKNNVLVALSELGCHQVKECRVRSNTSRYAETMSKILRVLKAPQCHMTWEPNGRPVVVVFFRKESVPYTLLMETRSVNSNDMTAPRMYMLRCKFTDDSVYDGTVLDATMLHGTDTVSCKDICAARGKPVWRLPVTERMRILQDVFRFHVVNECIDSVKFQTTDWRLVSRSDVAQSAADEDGQAFVWTSDRELWRTPTKKRPVSSS